MSQYLRPHYKIHYKVAHYNVFVIAVTFIYKLNSLINAFVIKLVVPFMLTVDYNYDGVYYRNVVAIYKS